MEHKLSTTASRLELSLRVLDVLAIGAAGQLASLLHFGATLSDITSVHAGLVYLCCTLAFFLLPQLGLYTSWRGRSKWNLLWHVIGAWSLVLLVGLFFSFLIHYVGDLSRLWVSLWFANGVLLLMLSRVIVYTVLHYLRRKGWNSKRVVIVGYGKIGQEMYQRALQQDELGYVVKAIHAIVGTEPEQIPDSSVDKIETLDEIHEYVQQHKINEIWLTLPIGSSSQLQHLQYLLRNELVDIRWIPDTTSMQILSGTLIDFMGLPAVDLNRPVVNGAGAIAKELFDKGFSLVLLILISPLLITIAIGIKLTSSGPVLFAQPRHGLNGRKFNVYKFRTMKLHQERGVVTQASKGDLRITPLGQFLRRTSLDELPQFFNVLIGDMSVVGPRPHAIQHNDFYKDKIDAYMLRHRVKPGITGWAQIHGYRGETDTEDKMVNRVECDLYYIRNWSFWMDLKIILWTAFRGWTSANAY